MKRKVSIKNSPLVPKELIQKIQNDVRRVNHENNIGVDIRLPDVDGRHPGPPPPEMMQYMRGGDRVLQLTPVDRTYTPQTFNNFLVNMQVFMKNVNVIRSLENGRKTQLEELALATIQRYYGNIVNGVKFDIKIVDSISDIARGSETTFDESEVDEYQDRLNSQQDDVADVQAPTLENQEEDGEEEMSIFDKMKKYFGGDKDEKKDGKSKIKSNDKSGNMFDFENVSEELQRKIHIRKFMNNIIQGEAKNTKNIFNTDFVLAGLSRIYGENSTLIVSLYRWVSNFASYKDWELDEESQMSMWKRNPNGFAGKVSVNWEDEEEKEEENDGEGDDSGDGDGPEGEEQPKRKVPVIRVEAKDFTMALHECVKGIYELIASSLIPEDKISAKIVRYNTDHYLNEIEDIRYGQSLASIIRDKINAVQGASNIENIREYTYGAIAKLEDGEIVSLFNDLLSNNSRGDYRLEAIVSGIIESITQYNEEVAEYQNEMAEYQRQLDEYNNAVAGRVETNKASNDDVDYSYLDRMLTSDLVNLVIETPDANLRKKIEEILKTR